MKCLQTLKNALHAVGVGFEPTRPLRVAVFETVPIDHSGTLPRFYSIHPDTHFLPLPVCTDKLRSRI